MAPQKLTLAGRLDDEDFQKSFECIQFLQVDRPTEFEFTILEMFPVEWEAHLAVLRHKDSVRIGSSTTCLVYSEDLKTVFQGDEFVSYISSITSFKIFPYEADSTDPATYKNQAKIRYKQFLKRTGHAFCFMDIKVGSEKTAERVVFELFTDVCPHTCQNFLHLCKGDMADQGTTDAKAAPADPKADAKKPAAADPKAAAPQHKMWYKGTNFFRIYKDGWIQGGDVINNKGTGGQSIFGPVFPDECFTIKHNAEGVLGMANNGKDTNASQFYVTVKRNSWMDGKYVAFGRVIEGISVVRRIHELKTHPDQRPTVPVVVADCGELPLNQF